MVHGVEAEPPPRNRHDHPSISGSLGYFHLRLLGPAAPLLLLRSGRLYSLSFSRRRGHHLRLLASPTRCHRRRHRDILLSTSGCVLRLTHHFSSADAVRVNGRPLHGGGPVDLAVGDEVSLLRRGVRYVFVVEKFVSCEGGEAAAGSRGEVLVLRAESLRKRLRAISESHDPLSFLRDSHCLENGSADAGLKKAREEDDFLCLDNPINPVPEENLPREDCNLDHDKLEHHSNVATDDIVALSQGSKGCSNGNVDHKGCNNGSVEQHHNEGCFSDGSTFFLNRLAGIGPDVPVEPHTGVTLPQLLHPVDSLVRVFVATFTSDISWFLDYCKIPQHLPVTIACHNKERCWSASCESRTSAPFESYPNLLLVYPQFPEVIAFGKDRKNQGVACHHPKLIVLQREDSLRVIVTSANLVPRQWHLITNTVWWQDFPCRTSPDYSALFSAVKQTKSDFAAQLVSFIGSLINEIPSQAYWINEIAKYDFEGAGGYLVASVPGLYVQSPSYLESNYCLSAKQILHTKSAHRTFFGSVQTSVVGLSHRFHIPSDAGSQLKVLSVFLGKCRENMHGTTEVILKRNTNIPADANAVSVLVADLDKFSEEDSVQLGFLPREVAKWVSPLSDLGFFKFSGFIYPKEALEAAFGVTNTKVQLLLYVSKGPEFSQISGLIREEHLPPLCSLVASLKRCHGLWRLEEVLSHFKWPETLETDFIYSASSIGTSINPRFIANFASAAGKRSNQDFDSEESDPEWGCWTAGHELKKPSLSLLFPTIDRVKNGACGIQLSRHLLSLPEKTWQTLRYTGIFHDAIPHPYDRIGHPMHVKNSARKLHRQQQFGHPIQLDGVDSLSEIDDDSGMSCRVLTLVRKSYYQLTGPCRFFGRLLLLLLISFLVLLAFLFYVFLLTGGLLAVARRRFESRLDGHSFGWTYCGSHNFSPAAWGQLLSPPSKANPSGPRLHICNYELGIILIVPPSGTSKKANGRKHGIDDISLPFVIPAPRYKQSDRPATSLAMREAMAEAYVPQSNVLVDLLKETDEDIPDEDDEHVVELSDCSPEEKEEEKIYAEMLWGQVDSSQSQEKDL